MVDLLVQNEGSIFVIHPQSDTGREWLASHLDPEPWQVLGEAIAVEHRCIGAIVDGAQADGLVCE